MADEIEKPETPPAEPPKEPPTTPQYVTADEFKRLESTITGITESIRDGFNAVATRTAGAAPKTEVDEPDVTDAEIEEALQQGKGAATFRKLVAKSVNSAKKELTTRLNDTEGFGVNVISELVKDAARPKMPYYDKEKHPKITKEIDEHLAQLTPQMRLSKDVLVKVHDAVVGGHMAEIIAAEKEAAIRGVQASPGSMNPTGSNSRTHGTGSKIPTVEEFLGKQAADSMKSFGQDPDTFAQKWGCKDWPDYVAKHREEGVA